LERSSFFRLEIREGAGLGGGEARPNADENRGRGVALSEALVRAKSKADRREGCNGVGYDETERAAASAKRLAVHLTPRRVDDPETKLRVSVYAELRLGGKEARP
jgi:hypothetical protein